MPFLGAVCGWLSFKGGLIGYSVIKFPFIVRVIGRRPLTASEWSGGDTIFQSNINPRLNYSEPSLAERGWEFNNKIII